MSNESGSVGACTFWDTYSVPAMWAIISGQDTEAIWQQATAWRNTADLTSRHMSNLQQYKAQLAAAWPPEGSPASSAYLAEFDKLIASVKETHDAAAANYSAVISLAGATSDAKRKLQPLYEEYQSNQRKLDDFERRTPDLIEGVVETLFPPVPRGRQEELDRQARSIMYDASSEIRVAGGALKPPAPYVPPTPRVDASEPGGSGGGGAGGGGGGASPVLVPPVIPQAPSTPSPDSSGGSTTPISGGSGGTGGPGGRGPVLGGAPTAPPVPTPVRPPVILPGAPPVPTPTPIPPIWPTPVAPGPGLAPPVGTGPGGTPGISTPPAGRAVTGSGGIRAMPPGGVIGGKSGAGLLGPGSGRPVARVNPTGGVIGGSARAGGQAGAHAPGARSGRRRDDEETTLQHWDPDNPWETDEGVTPVVLPPAESRRYDPGPAIGHGR